MKFCTVLGLVALVAISNAYSSNKQFLIRVDENQLRTPAAIQNFSDMIERQYKAYGVSSFSLGNVKLLMVKGQESDVMKVATLSAVKYVEHDERMSIFQCEEQSASGCWGLDRIDQRGQLPYSDPNERDATYVWGEDTGEGVVAYIVDTGLDHRHRDFGNRASHGYTAPQIPGDDDVNGHGTHCGGTVGSDSYGVAKGVELVGVKVLGDDGSGFTSWIVGGLEWVLDEHNSRGNNAKTVVNMSLGGGGSRSMDDAVEALIDAGAVVVAAAGNSDANACNTSPGRVPDALTVGGTQVDDQSYRFTNWGSCVDISAPAVNVLSTTPNNSEASFSGTSMAAPHVAGAVARYMSSLNNAPTPAQVADEILGSATRDAIKFRSGHDSSPNLLLYSTC